ncbi:DUF4157 domain-containing protein [Streptomyces sp. NPDC056910]|uniref:eCIS core domain-containing protein n=1 Tax=Streptomyces sp. NPDC056910 TaxID=3345964 RepID=UPI0036923EB0
MTGFSRAPRSQPEGGDSGSPSPRRAAEREADRAAQAALDPAARPGQRTVGEPPRWDRREGGPPGVGRPLEDADRRFFERRLGADLRSVRVHDDAAAARATEQEDSRGFTVGEHVVLAPDADRGVLAHELVHVLQQRRTGVTALQRQERSPGRTTPLAPPSAPFDVVRTRPAAEDARVLFEHDSTGPSGMDLTSLRSVLQGHQPLQVDVDGYASREGDGEYNVNLSAHRAATVAVVLEAMLPAGSVVRIHAHGATTEFGDDATANRRVGIRVTVLPQPQPPSSQAPSPQRQGGGLRLDPVQPPLPPGKLPDVPDVRLREPVPYYRDPRQPLPTLRDPGLADSPFHKPPPRTEEPLVNWPAVRQSFVAHGAGAIDPRTATAIEAHTRYWYERYRALGVPEQQARNAANLGTQVLVDRELSREGLTAPDRVNDELRRQGIDTTTGGIDLLNVLRMLKEKR